MIAIDLQTFSESFKGGKDQVAFNLLRGFQETGIANELVVYCNPGIKNKAEELCPDAIIKILPGLFSAYKSTKIVPLRKAGTFISFFSNSAKLRSFYINEINEMHISAILFTDKYLFINSKYPCKTFFITHDIQPLIRVMKESITTRIMIKKLVLKAFKYIDTAICISDYDLGECKKRFKNNLLRIYDPILFADNFIENLGTEYITAINIIHPHKNPLTLVRAFALIRDKIPSNIKLLFIGDESAYYNILSLESEKLGIKDRIVFSGYVSEEKKNSLLTDTRLFVNASIFEGFGMAAVEVMATGIPCIVADNTAQRESTMDLCRYYAPATDENALAKAILEEINNPPSLELRRKCAETIRKEYDYKSIAKKYWEVLNA